MAASAAAAQLVAWPPDARARDALAGASAGVCNVLALHPLDVVKTRLQVQDGRATPDVYRGTVHAFKTIVRAEGWRGLYAGLSPALVGGSLAWGLYFASYNHAKARYAGWSGHGDASALPSTAHLAAAAEAGAVVSVLTNPLWVAKTRLQLQRRGADAAATSADAAPYRGLADALRRIAAQEGLPGLYRGLLPSLALVSHGALQFAAYEALKKRALASERGADAADAAADVAAARLSAGGAGAIGVASKLFASGVTYPSQVLRARLQQRADASPDDLARRGMWRTLRTLLAREGLRGLYKGWVPNVLRVLPSSALTFLVYEKASQAMEGAGRADAGAAEARTRGGGSSDAGTRGA